MDRVYKDRKSGVGVIFRNWQGSVQASSVFPIYAGISPLHIEILAVLQGLEPTAVFNLTYLIIETDCLEVLHGIRNSTMAKSTFGHYFEPIKRMASELESVFLLHKETGQCSGA